MNPTTQRKRLQGKSFVFLSGDECDWLSAGMPYSVGRGLDSRLASYPPKSCNPSSISEEERGWLVAVLADHFKGNSGTALILRSECQRFVRFLWHGRQSVRMFSKTVSPPSENGIM